MKPNHTSLVQNDVIPTNIFINLGSENSILMNDLSNKSNGLKYNNISNSYVKNNIINIKKVNQYKFKSKISFDDYEPLKTNKEFSNYMKIAKELRYPKLKPLNEKSTEFTSKVSNTLENKYEGFNLLMESKGKERFLSKQHISNILNFNKSKVKENLNISIQDKYLNKIQVKENVIIDNISKNEQKLQESEYKMIKFENKPKSVLKNITNQEVYDLYLKNKYNINQSNFQENQENCVSQIHQNLETTPDTKKSKLKLKKTNKSFNRHSLS